MKQENFFFSGFGRTLPITMGIIPFGAVMGTVSANANLTFFQSVTMNVSVFAGASQMAAVDLMTKNTGSIVVVVTGLIINLRFILYSAALSPIVQKTSFIVKLFCAYNLTDQSYAVMSAHQHRLKTNSAAIQFYLGACACMALAWHLAVAAGFAFGNFAPTSLALDFAVPLSFVSLVMPTLKNRNYLLITVFSSIISVLLHPLPFKIGLVVTAILAIGFAQFLTRKKFVS